jgi:hypothetical protein
MDNNNRRYKRYAVTGIHGNVLNTSDLEVLNISISGAAVETRRRLELNRGYTFKIKYKDKYLTLRGCVVWATLFSKEDEDSKNVVPVYKAGIKFVETLGEKTDMLLDFIEENKIKMIENRSMGMRFKVGGVRDMKLDFPYSYTVKKLSQGGMLIETEYCLDLNSRHDIELYLGEHELNIEGRVANCEENLSDGVAKYDAGIEFITMSDEDRGILKDFLNTLD